MDDVELDGNRMEITTSATGWSVAGEIDASTSPRLAEAVAELPDVAGRPVEIDLGEVTFIDSSGLRVLIGLADRLAGAGGSLVVRNPSSSVARLLQITGLEAMFGLGQDTAPPAE